MSLQKYIGGVTNPMQNHSSMMAPLLSISYIYLNRPHLNLLTCLEGSDDVFIIFFKNRARKKWIKTGAAWWAKSGIILIPPLRKALPFTPVIHVVCVKKNNRDEGVV